MQRSYGEGKHREETRSLWEWTQIAAMGSPPITLGQHIRGEMWAVILRVSASAYVLMENKGMSICMYV